MIVFFFFLLGTIFGSFANVLIIRLKEATSLGGRSKCVHCGMTLAPKHLVPILSWLYLRGKCAGCRKPIHMQYPVVELVMGVLFAVAIARYPFAWMGVDVLPLLLELLLSFFLVVLVAFDLRWQLVPIELTAVATAILVAVQIASGMPLLTLLIGMGVPVLFFAAQVVVSRGKWMGSGDPWVGAFMGAALGWPLVGIGLYFSYLVGGVAAVFLLATGAVRRGARIAFVPLLAAGTLLALWFGESVVIYLQGYF